MLRAVHFLGTALAALCLGVPAAAQDCRSFKLTAGALERWYNPHPSREDFLLPMPLGMSLAFVSIPLGTEGLYGDEKSTYRMGSSTPRLFETNLEVRVGSSIAGGGEARFLFGKYEVTKAQYISVMGRGVLKQGVRMLSERTRDPRARTILDPFIDGPCEGVLTREVYQFLSEPLTFLSYRDYIDFLDEYNLYCITRNDCRQKLSQLGSNRQVPGFVRLPAEHEWEFVARGGGKYVAGEISKNEFQADLPRVAPGTTILKYAHVGSDPPRPLPIGSREPLFGIHDMLGNAQELMLNPFTAENGYGAVGSYVARGGHFRLPHDELRVSRRVELQAFRLDEDRDSFVIQYFPLTGIRLVVGYPVFGAAQRVGDESLLRDFLENYAPPSEAGDIAGNTTANARNLGMVGDTRISVREELSQEDSLDFYKITLGEYSTLSVALFSDAGVHFDVFDELQETVITGSSNGRQMRSKALLPGDYWIKLSASGNFTKEQRYRIEVSRTLVPDTGIDRPDPSALTHSAISLRTSLNFSGYVGQGDTVDTFPIRDLSAAGGLELQVRNLGAPVSLTYLDERLNTVHRIEIDPKEGNRVLVLNSSYGGMGFVQVSALPKLATTYSLTVLAKAPYDRIFLKRPVAAYSGPFGSDNISYEGNLGESLPRLYLPIRLDGVHILRLELTGLSADADLKVLGADGSAIPSTHVRAGTAPEFFSEQVPAGLYYAEVGLKSSRDLTSFKLLKSIENVRAPLVQNPDSVARLIAMDLGVIDENGASGTSSIDRETIYYRFSILGDEQHLVIELRDFLQFADLDIYLEDFAGKVLSSSLNGGGIAERIEYLAAAGIYFLRIRKAGWAPSSNFHMSIFKTGTMRDPDLSFLGTYLSSIDDYDLYWDWSEDACTMVTLAKQVVPERGWRTQRPFFFIRVEEENDTIGIGMDFLTGHLAPADIFRNGTVSARVKGFSTVLGRIPAEWDGNLLKPLSYNFDALNVRRSSYIDSDAIRKFVAGATLELRGSTPRGELAKIEYSLLGYKLAAQLINTLCGANADWIWNP